MNEEKKQLLSRMEKLEVWQKDMLLFDYLWYADGNRIQNIKEEVGDYERINEEIEEEYGQKNNPLR